MPSSTSPAVSLSGKRILLIISGGIAAYKSLDLIRRLRERGASVRPVMTAGAQAFVTPLAVGALSADKVFTELFSREDEQDVGHIRLARECDLVLVAPATANIMAKMAQGMTDDLASTILLATDRPVLLAPAMNPKMWSHPATRRNRDTLAGDGIAFVGPGLGEMAESGERGEGRMAEPLQIVAAVESCLEGSQPLAAPTTLPLSGRHAIVTSGPTHEPIDPVRYIANRSSGRQGHAIAAALARLGANVTLVSGPVTIADPAGVTVVPVQTAVEMRDAVLAALPADAAVMVAAVADWRVADVSGGKIKKAPGEAPPPLQLTENPDILKTVGHHAERPRIVVGFAAETDDPVANGRLKLARKGADIIVANDVSAGSGVAGGVMGGTRNRVTIIGRDGEETWPELDKEAVADRLAALIASRLA
ncbi:bifunctional phosphopantothenoylcysteine decarboxylase/phosphopantothenate--cysteine ligase CoaBC [Rhizobium sp. Leaf341]|uniref:bifunctional phosphopantothenoylcysteine decarboxylase/phosphopantothenate--cysteine ligase CoaBC n=1 Tax=Rhizobium sp. Leaf341 TaxID=1736344 RepID=UPI000715D54A|nr:bifunctional phosphopantothenoylcysteine decarboxylase/phosphopantothenate--cysteine ligase CoaBC [Rhizobium sp. Leaf341]KQR78145.1 bifunctional phosphopantothenoylcysteine decarboxylase/phosphopantothenate synthase [Rhizobium sp. Leaf341]